MSGSGYKQRYGGGRRVKHHIPVYKGTRDDEREADLFEARARALAPVLGFCGYCGVDVDEVNGKLHGHDCSVQAERRRAR